jgi:hypothetical protein
MNSLSSRQRMLAALNYQVPDHPPCSFMLYGGLKSECQSYDEFIDRQLELGLDTFVELPVRPPVVVNDYYNLHGLPVSYDPRVTITEEKLRLPGEQWPILVKQYHTPAGILCTEVRQTSDWRWGNHVPFLDDYLVPRSRKFLVTGPQDLDALRYLLVSPTAAEVVAFQQDSKTILNLAERHQLLITGGWGVGADLLGWICGLDQMIYDSYDRPDFIKELLEIIALWNRQRMEVVLQAGIDLYIKRAWYENCDFWSPAAWRRFIFPVLKADVDLAHRHGVKFGYIITARCMPLLDYFIEAGVDVLLGVDPAQWDLPLAKQKLAGKICLWGGVNGHLTVEQGTADMVRSEVDRAMHILAPGGGFILSPVDNVRESTALSKANVQRLIGVWQEAITQSR